MKKKYFYGLEDQETYCADNREQAFDDASNELYSGEPITITIVEMSVNKKDRVRWCQKYQDFSPDCNDCSDKKYIGKSHICENLGWSLSPTGAKWEYNTINDIIAKNEKSIDQINGDHYLNVSKINKISGRNKQG
jgi:hypothetical protein